MEGLSQSDKIMREMKGKSLRRSERFRVGWRVYVIKCMRGVLLPVRVVEGDGIYNILVTLQSVQILPRCRVPYFTCPIVASSYKTANRWRVKETY